MSPNPGVSLTILRALPIFEMLDDDVPQAADPGGHVAHIPRHTVVLNAGDRTDNIYFVYRAP
jgi:hypothetical protein